jgi:hypothetical protein
MQLCAILTKDDITSVIEQITPLRVALRTRRVITLGRPRRIDLVEGAGLRVRGAARFTWDALGVTIPVTLRSWQILLVPSFKRRQNRRVLAFEPVLEELDFKNVPMFLDGRIAEAINEGLAAQKDRLSWDFEKHLSVMRQLPEKMSPSGEAKLAPTGGSVVVTVSEMRLTLDFAVTLSRDAIPPSMRTTDVDSSPDLLAR